MHLAHSFRLRDPWQCERSAGGGLRWSRVFHRPTGLEDDDALWLVCSSLPAEARVTLNGTPLAPAAATDPAPPPSATAVRPMVPLHQYEVTSLIADTNRVELDIPPASSPPPPTADGPWPTADGPLPTAFPYDVRLGILAPA